MTEWREKTDIQLMLATQSGADAAFGELHARYQRRVCNFFYGLGARPADANDLTQETFVRVWQVRKRYRATGSFAGYLFGVARFIWMEWLREERNQARLGWRMDAAALEYDLPCGRPLPDARADQREAARQLDAALAELPEEQRVVFVLRSIQGMSLDDIAQAMDCPLNTIRSRKILAVKKLRHLLSDWFFGSRSEGMKEETGAVLAESPAHEGRSV